MVQRDKHWVVGMLRVRCAWHGFEALKAVLLSGGGWHLLGLVQYTVWVGACWGGVGLLTIAVIVHCAVFSSVVPLAISVLCV